MSRQVRLYSSNHATCVAVGEVQSGEEASSWLRKISSKLRLVGRQRQVTRVLVKISKALKPGGFVLYKGAPPAPPGASKKATVQQVVDSDGFVLWDIKHVRPASAHKPFTEKPDGIVSDTDGAYQDDGFFAAAAPPAVVHRRGNILDGVPVLWQL